MFIQPVLLLVSSMVHFFPFPFFLPLSLQKLNGRLPYLAHRYRYSTVQQPLLQHSSPSAEKSANQVKQIHWVGTWKRGYLQKNGPPPPNITSLTTTRHISQSHDSRISFFFSRQCSYDAGRLHYEYSYRTCHVLEYVRSRGCVGTQCTGECVSVVLLVIQLAAVSRDRVGRCTARLECAIPLHSHCSLVDYPTVFLQTSKSQTENRRV